MNFGATVIGLHVKKKREGERESLGLYAYRVWHARTDKQIISLR
jgi:hypothetical protein